MAMAATVCLRAMVIFVIAALCACSGPGARSYSPASGSVVAKRDVAKALLYVTNVTTLNVYDLATGKLEQIISGFDGLQGLCSDVHGNVYAIDVYQQTVSVYAHGGRYPIRYLSDAGYDPQDCSVDPVTGNLAVTNYSGTGSNSVPGTVAIYAKAQGKPKFYRDRNIANYYYCTYDSKGNLYVDGYLRNSGGFGFAELPAKQHLFTDIALDVYFLTVGDVKWDGQHVAVADGKNTIDRFAISGHSGKRVGETLLVGADGLYQFWLHDGTIYTSGIFYKGGQPAVGYYRYPAGGKPYKTIIGLTPAAAAVSIVK